MNDELPYAITFVVDPVEGVVVNVRVRGVVVTVPSWPTNVVGCKA